MINQECGYKEITTGEVEVFRKLKDKKHFISANIHLSYLLHLRFLI